MPDRYMRTGAVHGASGIDREITSILPVLYLAYGAGVVSGAFDAGRVTMSITPIVLGANSSHLPLTVA